MSRAKEVLTAVGTLTCALGIGFAMQNSESASHRYGGSEVRTPEPSKPIVSGDLQVEVSDITLTSALSQLNKRRPVIAKPEANASTSFSQVAMLDGNSQFACDVDVTATAQAAATVELRVFAACAPNMPVTVEHNGMVFAETLDPSGSLKVNVPALAETAVFMVSLNADNGVIAHAQVTDIANYNRVVLQWEGDAGFELHAREFGADYGAKGHVWRASDRSIDVLKAGQGGLVQTLGARFVSEAKLAEIYTFPAQYSVHSGEIDVSVEAQVTASNCGKTISAKTLELRGSGDVHTRDLVMSVPDCLAAGDYLVLNNPLEDLKIAAR